MLNFFWMRQKKDGVSETHGQKTGKNHGRYKRLPKTLNELDDSYRAMIRELAKR